MDKDALEQVLSSSNWWMGLSTVAVAVGILGEYVAHFVFEEDARRNKREMAVSVLFGILVLGGVVGEYIFGKKLSQVSEQLQQIADTDVAQSNKDAAQARRDAETAKEQSAQLRKEAEDEKLARLRIEARLAPRRVSSEQRRQLCSAIHVKGRYTLEIQSSFGTTEADDFGEDIAKAAEGCGLAVTFAKSVLIYPVPDPMRIAFAPGRKHDADIIANAMLKAKIATRPIERFPVPDADQHPDALRLFVGPKSE
jgi:outer membrane murein-binding lipoprotein Lpp